MNNFDNSELNMIFDLYKYEIIMTIIVVFFFNKNFGLIFMIIIILIFLLNYNKNIVFNDNISKIKKNINDNPSTCRPSTLNNPYGNYLLGENVNISACTDKENLNKNIKYNNFNVYTNANNISIGSTNKIYRNFYTKPVTKYPNDSKDFATWVYRNIEKLTCKNNNNCLLVDDVRYHSR